MAIGSSATCLSESLSGVVTLQMRYRENERACEPYVVEAEIVSLSSRGLQVVHSPAQEATPVKLGRNAERVSSEALAKEDLLLQVFRKKPKPPRLYSRGAPPTEET